MKNSQPAPQHQPGGYVAPAGYPAAPPLETKAGCQLTRGQLDQYLEQSGYGSNAAMFACYFTRKDPNSPPLCIACGQPVACHEDGTTAAIALGQMADDGEPPSGLVKAETHDVKVTQNIGYPIAASIMFIGATGLLVGGTVGGIMISPAMYAAPALAFVFGIPFAFLQFRHVTTIQHDASVPREERTIHMDGYRFATICCGPSVTESTWGQIQKVDMQIGRTKRGTYGVVVLVCDGDANYPLFLGQVPEAELEAARWRRYFGHA